MPTIKYSKNPNVETAFVEQDDGSKNRVILTAPQDISTIEYPSNPNSTKAYVTVNGKKQRVIMTADISGGGGGSSLPDQTGNAGKFLTTDGTDASWSDITKVNTTITLTAAGWSSNTQSVTVNGVTSSSVVFVSPDPTNVADYVAGGIICTAQGTNSLTFSCSTTPANDIDVVIVVM